MTDSQEHRLRTVLATVENRLKKHDMYGRKYWYSWLTNLDDIVYFQMKSKT